MKLNYLLILGIALGSCAESSAVREQENAPAAVVAIPQRAYEWQAVFFHRKNSLWQLRLDSTNISGFITEKYANGQTAKHFGVVDGKREGVLTAYYPDGERQYLESYRNNKLDGMVKRWSRAAGYQLLAELSYKAGKLDGVQKKWFPTGELHKLMHMKAGKEEGLQQAFRKNGALYANYEAREGRIFGLKRSNLCYELDNQQVVYVE